MKAEKALRNLDKQRVELRARTVRASWQCLAVILAFGVAAYLSRHTSWSSSAGILAFFPVLLLRRVGGELGREWSDLKRQTREQQERLARQNISKRIATGEIRPNPAIREAR